MKNRMLALLAAASLSLTMAACSSDDGGEAGDGSTGEVGSGLKVYATTGYLADAVANIAPGAEVTTMVGPGGDPHTYEPSTQDIQTIQSSDLVLWNGLHLEAQMIDQLESLGDRQLAVGEELSEDMLLDWPETDDEGNALHDPHIWNSPENWKIVVEKSAEKLGEVDPDNADAYMANAKAYNEKIDEAAEQARELLEKIPAEDRILITGHDAFNYFGDTYDLKVYATDFVTSEAQKTASEISEMADLIAEKKVPTIFLDNLANPQAITSLKEAVESRGWDVKISDEELFADSLGEGENVDTYLEVFIHNATAISEGLTK